ncbi:MAG TPA: inositol phosphorylceramide synthase, partial [Acidimicrobiaceae bacterium]|nr:inositol phosphorylceramide synthase [Acidimicrobiaceae bacterium]
YDVSPYGAVGTGISQQFAAMPSIHVAWAAIVSIGAVAASTSKWRWFALLHLIITVLIVAGTGHHWWADGLIIAPLLIASLALDRYGRRILAPVISRYQSPPGAGLI